MINRNIAPPVSAINRPSLWQYQKKQLANGIEIVYLHDPAQEVFKIDVSFAAGAYYQPRPVTASTMLNMLNEGTRRHSAEEIAETFDYHGAYVDYNCGMHKSEISLISLTKYASPTIRMLAELVEQRAQLLKGVLAHSLRQIQEPAHPGTFLGKPACLHVISVVGKMGELFCGILVHDLYSSNM